MMIRMPAKVTAAALAALNGELVKLTIIRDGYKADGYIGLAQCIQRDIEIVKSKLEIWRK